MKEFDLIRTRLSRLADPVLSDGLRDDAAELPDLGRRGMVTSDTLVEGVHFFSDDPMETVGQKLVRVNVSDCFAKGAYPRYGILNLTWPKTRSDEDLEKLIDGLESDLSFFGIRLLGGDTTVSSDTIFLNLTIMGECGEHGRVRRSGASAGEDIWVSGTIGDAYLGLLKRRAEKRADLQDTLIRRFLVPELAPSEIVECVRTFATASLDVSDGLIADLSHLADVSECGAVIRFGDVPFSAEAQACFDLSEDGVVSHRCLGGGDDYQVLFSASFAHRSGIEAWSSATGVKLTRIGQTTSEAGVVQVVNANGIPIEGLTPGWEHSSTG